MSTLVVFDFPSNGSFGAEATTAYAELAADIATEPNLVWKVWIEDPSRQVAGGVYLFTDRAAADTYIAKHTERLSGFGISSIKARVYEVNEELSRIDHAILFRP